MNRREMMAACVGGVVVVGADPAPAIAAPPVGFTTFPGYVYDGDMSRIVGRAAHDPVAYAINRYAVRVPAVLGPDGVGNALTPVPADPTRFEFVPYQTVRYCYPAFGVRPDRYEKSVRRLVPTVMVVRVMKVAEALASAARAESARAAFARVVSAVERDRLDPAGIRVVCPSSAEFAMSRMVAGSGAVVVPEPVVGITLKSGMPEPFRPWPDDMTAVVYVPPAGADPVTASIQFRAYEWLTVERRTDENGLSARIVEDYCVLVSPAYAAVAGG